MSLRPRSRRLPDLKSVPVLPSLITLGNLFFGFLAMAKVTDAVRGGGVLDEGVLPTFEIAALFIFLAMVFDALDGRIARMTNQTTAFGAQLDSLADLLTFGVAPAFIAKALINLYEGPPTDLLPPHPKLYYFCAAVYVLCAAMRLARFNVESTPDEKDHREFQGLPTPGAAAAWPRPTGSGAASRRRRAVPPRPTPLPSASGNRAAAVARGRVCLRCPHRTPEAAQPRSANCSNRPHLPSVR